MNKREQKFTTKLVKWMRWKKFNYSFKWEVKVINTEKTPNWAYKSDGRFEKQMRCLLPNYSVEKLSDAAGAAFGIGTPYDGYTLYGPGYFIIHWKRRGNKTFYMIPADELNQFILKEKPKSITEEHCRHLGTICELR